MSLTLVGSRPRLTEASRTDVTTLTAIVTLAADSWFELHILQLPDLVVHATSLDSAPDAVLSAAARSTGRHPNEFDVQLQY
ncbi:hypothetical protein AB0N65_17010 [Paenarthrobacter sp. NPDC089322]|uniref:hypothetical protein n=1 Tax=Paenarthrobacter sp. NPDC089322 TaxID=3155065 RepID=UPI003440942D